MNQTTGEETNPSDDSFLNDDKDKPKEEEKENEKEPEIGGGNFYERSCVSGF